MTNQPHSDQTIRGILIDFRGWEDMELGDYELGELDQAQASLEAYVEEHLGEAMAYMSPERREDYRRHTKLRLEEKK